LEAKSRERAASEEDWKGKVGGGRRLRRIEEALKGKVSGRAQPSKIKEALKGQVGGRRRLSSIEESTRVTARLEGFRPVTVRRTSELTKRVRKK
jgi:hypothetical protein